MDTILKTSENTDKLWPAYIQAKHEMNQPELNCTNPHFRSKYADLSSCFKAIKEPFKANGLICTQTFGYRDGQATLETRIVHVSGQWFGAEWHFNPDTNIQKMGSQFTYLKRYHLYSLLGLAGEEDTDGQVQDRKTGKVEPIRTVTPYNPKADAFDQNNRGAVSVLHACLKRWEIDESFFSEITAKCHGTKADQWGAIAKAVSGKAD